MQSVWQVQPVWPVRLAPAKVWLEFGHLQTFFQSKLAVTTARAFNTVRIDGQTARKSSADEAKIWAEAHWLQEIPPAVQIHCARLLGFGAQDGRVFYETEYEFLPVLSELFVFGAVARLTQLLLRSREGAISPLQEEIEAPLITRAPDSTTP